MSAELSEYTTDLRRRTRRVARAALDADVGQCGALTEPAGRLTRNSVQAIVPVMKRAAFLTSILFVASCAVDMPLEIAEQDDPIVNGTPTDGFREVVQVIGAQTNGGACTGTLIGTQTVLTAAHCVFGGATATVVGTMRECEGTCFWVPYSMSGDVVVHPNYSLGGLNDDFALIRLPSQVDLVPPARIAITMAVGLPITIVGYGETGLNQNDFAKRSGQNTISNLDDMFLYFPSTDGSGLCLGDSGGPAYASPGLCTVGVAKGQDPGTCGPGAPYRESRVDNAVSWILNNAGETIQLCWP